MELLYIVLLIIVIALLITMRQHQTSVAERQEARLAEMHRLLQNLVQKRAETANPEPTVIPKEPAHKPVELPLPPAAKPPVVTERHPEVITPAPAPRPAPQENPVNRPQNLQRPQPVLKPAEPELSFFERHPDLEKFIGENLINKIGIAILVLAIGFFVKYAIDNNWIGPVGRVGIGVLCGCILIAIAHRLRTSYKAFSSVLVGGGLAILYFTITLAYHQFHLFNQLTSFIILIVITCFAVALSLLYDKQELAVIALVGGLSSPFMVSSGHANYNGLFIYLVILNAGLLVIAYYKSWRILNAAAFGLTVLVYCVVLTSLTAPTYKYGFIYASILYLLFFGINVANNVKENKKFIASDFSILLINTALYFSAGLYLLTVMDQEHLKGAFSISLAVINLLLSFVMFKNRKTDVNILYLLIGITLTFISLTAPLQLNGHYITLFWSAEAVLLYWLYLKSDISLMKLASLLIWALSLLSLLMDWFNVYGSESLLTVIINKGFITTIVVAVGSYLLYKLVKTDGKAHLYNVNIPANIFRYAAIIVLFLSGILEINHQFNTRYPGTDLNIAYLMLYTPVFVYCFRQLYKRVNGALPAWKVDLSIMAVCVGVYILTLQKLFYLEYNLLTLHNPSIMHFWAHGAAAIFIGLLLFELIKLTRSAFAEQPLASWVMSAVIVLFLSLEICLLSNLLFYAPGKSIDRIETVYIKVGLPILWGLTSFALMTLGMRKKLRVLRIISLTLFSITLIKLFLFDIKGIPPAGKIAAFFCLGILLLIVSFMYQKVKKILVDDEAAKKVQ